MVSINPTQAIESILINNMDGKILQKIKNSATEIDMFNFPKGVYLLKIQLNDTKLFFSKK